MNCIVLNNAKIINLDRIIEIKKNDLYEFGSSKPIYEIKYRIEAKTYISEKFDNEIERDKKYLKIQEMMLK